MTIIEAIGALDVVTGVVVGGVVNAAALVDACVAIAFDTCVFVNATVTTLCGSMTIKDAIGVFFCN